MKALLIIAALFCAMTAGVMVASGAGVLPAAQTTAETCGKVAGKTVDVGIKGIEFAVDTIKNLR